MASSIQSQLADINRRSEAIVKGFNRTERKRILRKGARRVVLETRKTTAFKDRTGTLRKSLNRIPGLRSSLDEFVGPLRGKNRRYDGFYAQMVFGSAKEFKRRVLDPAALRAAPSTLSALKVEAQKAIQRLAQKNKLR